MKPGHHVIWNGITSNEASGQNTESVQSDSLALQILSYRLTSKQVSYSELSIIFFSPVYYNAWMLSVHAEQ